MTGHISIFRVSLIVAALGAIGACAGGLDPGVGGGGGSGGSGLASCGGASGTSALATWANVRDVVDNTCFGSDCHVQGEREPILLGTNSVALSDMALYDKLTTYKTALCGQRVLVKPCAPDQSAFYLAQAGTCGDVPQMPFGCVPKYDNCTSADKLEGLRQWIANGAPRP
jgi:hypothetical protein